MTKRIVISLAVALAMVWSASAYAQVSGEQRIVEPIVINGQRAMGVLVIQDGTVRAYMCSAPQSYVTENQSESGWACFDQASGTWLLHAQPPAQAAVVPSQQPVVVYTQPSRTYVVGSSYPFNDYYPSYYPSYYPYYSSYYPYYYPYSSYFVGPRFGFGFGFRSPVFVNRPVVVGRSFGPVIHSGGFVGGFRSSGGRMGVGGRMGHR